MTVSDLIEELKSLPPHHPILCDVGLRYAESIMCVETSNLHGKVGVVAVIRTVTDDRNYKDEF